MEKRKRLLSEGADTARKEQHGEGVDGAGAGGGAMKKGSAKCPHNRQRSKCKSCGGPGICEHNRERRTCKECGICEHSRQRSQCNPAGRFLNGRNPLYAHSTLSVRTFNVVLDRNSLYTHSTVSNGRNQLYKHLTLFLVYKE